jgi:hypothetical protein
MRFGSEKYKPRHDKSPNEPERMDAPPTGSQLVEQLRASLIPGQPTHLGPDDLHQAIQLASSEILDDDIAKELLGSAYELNRGAVHAGTRELEPLLAQLTTAIYGTPEVGPVQLYDRRQPGSAEQPLHRREQIFESTGMTMVLRVAPGRETEDMLSNPNATLRFRLGPEDTWYMQIGNQEAVALAPETPITMGRAPHGHDSDPYTLGTNTNTSRSHLTIEAIPSIGLKVTDHSTLGTHFLTQQYPDPSQFRGARFERLSDDDDRLISDARQRIDQL